MTISDALALLDAEMAEKTMTRVRHQRAHEALAVLAKALEKET